MKQKMKTLEKWKIIDGAKYNIPMAGQFIFPLLLHGIRECVGRTMELRGTCSSLYPYSCDNFSSLKANTY